MTEPCLICIKTTSAQGNLKKKNTIKYDSLEEAASPEMGIIFCGLKHMAYVLSIQNKMFTIMQKKSPNIAAH